MSFPSIFRGHPLVGFTDATEALDRPLDRLFEGLLRGAASAPAAGFAPHIDVVERDGEYLVTAELPGLEEKDVQLEVHGDVLTLHGEKRAEHEGERQGWRYRERSYGSFRRSIRLPVEVDSGKASASFKSGVLTVTLPKAESARMRQIPVNPA